MAFSLLADAEVGAVTDLTPDWCRRKGIRLLLLDFDNTIVPYKETRPPQTFLRWMEELHDAGIAVMVVSNSRRSRRVPGFCDPLGIPWMNHAGKPRPRGIRKAMAQQGAGPEEPVMAGDQPFTDGLGGNLAGVASVLVKPIRLSSPFHIIRYNLERPFIALGRRKRKRFEKID